MGKKDPDENSRFQMEELILVKADMQRTYVGTLKRETRDGVKILRGKVKVEEGSIVGVAGSDEDLYEAMDSICILKLDMGLHSFPEPSFSLSTGSVSLN